jgi:hypothetical protein
MIPKKPAPDLIRGVQWFSEKIMLKLKVYASATTTDKQSAPKWARPVCDGGCAV